MELTVKLFLFCFLQVAAFFSFAQHKILFVVKQSSLLHVADDLFIAGNFNSWDPADKKFEFAPDSSGIAKVTVLLPGGDYEYKFTRGSWDKVETSGNGKGIANRSLHVTSDLVVNVDVEGWSDDFTSAIPSIKHSASLNVKIIDTAFFIPQLKRYRRIWIYLPSNYEHSKKHYAVLYMHDAQNLFDNFTSYSGEWGIDEYLDSISTLHGKEVIVVGIDNGLTKRMSEYNPYSFQQFGKGEGDKYVDFLVKTLKPFIDKHYKTLPGKENTYIAGSSMGGLISLYAILKYPSVYGGAGIFSPAFWTASGIDSMIDSMAKYVHGKLFFYAGGKEGESMIPDMKRIEKEIKATSSSSLKEVIDDDAKHNETAWRKYFPAFYKWAIMAGHK